MRYFILTLLVACGTSEPVPVFGPPTETVCPPDGTTLTYANFAGQFMTDYCTRCHAQNLEGAACSSRS